MRILDRWTLTASVALIIGALLACKKKEEAPPPVASAPPPPTATAEPPKEEKKDEKKEVKRYGDKEKDESGTVRVTYANAKVYNEADDTTDHIATLSSGTLVNRKARYGNWMLVDWPSGPGELSPGWMMTKQLDVKIVKIDLEKVKNQDAGVQINDASVAVVVPDAAAVAINTDAGAVAVTTDAATVVIPEAGAPAVTVDAGGGRLKWKFGDIKKAAEGAK